MTMMLNIRRLLILLIICSLIILPGCSQIINYIQEQPQSAIQNTPLPIGQSTQVELIFNLEVLLPPSKDQKIYLDILDEVTGLPLNPLRYTMVQKDPNHYQVHVVEGANTTVKYHYVKDGSPTIPEFTSQGKPVRYRIYQATGPGVINDVVGSWADNPYLGPTGRIQGEVKEIGGKALQNIMVTAGGMQTLTSSSGSFLLDGLPPGVQNLVVYSLNGDYHIFQQGAVVFPESSTPVSVNLEPTRVVRITFLAQPPVGTQYSINQPLRLVGNTYDSGNTFGDLNGGVSTTALRSPVMQQTKDGRFSFTTTLPVGFNFQYKYSLGDGFWNSEQTLDGHFRIRSIIVPENDSVIEDKIETWDIPNWGPIKFNLQVPPSLPKDESVFIQFNPYDWTEPVPMVPGENNNWSFSLLSPLNLLGQVSYRYCLDSQCGIADGILNLNGKASRQSFTPGNTPQTINDEVISWKWLGTQAASGTENIESVNPRGSNFWAGVQFQPNYQLSWDQFFERSFQRIIKLNANWVVLPLTWSCTNVNLPTIEPMPGKDMLWPDVVRLARQAEKANLNVALFPSLRFPMDSKDWWISAKRDAGWWQSWFDRYRVYMLNFADLAQTSNASALILGGPPVYPSLPDGVLGNGSPSGVPDDTSSRWENLIKEIRGRFQGKLLWAVVYPGEISNLPQFVSQFDQIYLLWSVPLITSNNSPEINLIKQAAQLLDMGALPFYSQLNKPVVLSIEYPSISGAARGCIDPLNACQSFDILDQPSNIQNPEIDFQEQANLYKSILYAVNDRKWINGVISRGYYPPLPLVDYSSSINGKPAEALLTFWFSGFFAK